jgi:hypothetical protein
MYLRTLSIALALVCVSATSSGNTAQRNDVESVLARFADEATLQINAADQDLLLVDMASKNFSTAESGLASKFVETANTALAPLREKYGDVRLNVSSYAGRCTALRAISDARATALNRKIRGLDKRINTADLQALYASIQAKFLAGKILGKPVSGAEMTEIFLGHLRSQKPSEPEIGWTSLDTVGSAMSASDSCI